jgi:hypothetical protein
MRRCGRGQQPGKLVGMALGTRLLQKEALQLLGTVVHPLAVRGIDHPNQSVRLLEVVLPVCPERLLATDIP